MSSRPSTFPLTIAGPVRLYSLKELIGLPPPTWLVESIVPAGGLVGLYGEPGKGKSFIALDLALSVATGVAWHGHLVTPGYVVYISAEGGTGMGKRGAAWAHLHAVDPDQASIAFLVESIPIHTESEQMALLVRRVLGEVEEEPSLVVIDTLARCFDGDENLQEDMGRFIAGVDELRHTLNTTVMVIHHTRVGGERERGSTAFRGAADTMLSLTGDGSSLTLSCDKQKDAERFPDESFQLEVVPEYDSCAVQSLATLEQQGLGTVIDYLQEHPSASIREIEQALSLSHGTAARRVKKAKGLVQDGGTP